MKQANHNLIYFNEVDKGGHFAAWEEPQIFSEEMRAAFSSCVDGGASGSRERCAPLAADCCLRAPYTGTVRLRDCARMTPETNSSSGKPRPL